MLVYFSPVFTSVLAFASNSLRDQTVKRSLPLSSETCIALEESRPRTASLNSFGGALSSTFTVGSAARTDENTTSARIATSVWRTMEKLRMRSNGPPRRPAPYKHFPVGAGLRGGPRGASARRERADKRTAAAAVAPRLVQFLALEAVLGRHRGLRGDALCQRRVLCHVVAAGLVVIGDEAA